MVLLVGAVVVDGEARALGVWLTVVLSPALIDEEPRELDVPRVAGRVRELYQRELDLLVAGNVATGLRAEVAVDEIREADGDVQDTPLPRRPIMSDRGLDEMAGVVELVASGGLMDPPLVATPGAGFSGSMVRAGKR